MLVIWLIIFLFILIHVRMCVGLEAIAVSCPLLQTVFLRRCLNVTDDGVIALAKSCHQLIELNIGGCHLIRDASLLAIAQNCRMLRSFNFSKTKASHTKLMFRKETNCRLGEPFNRIISNKLLCGSSSTLFPVMNILVRHFFEVWLWYYTPNILHIVLWLFHSVIETFAEQIVPLITTKQMKPKKKGTCIKTKQNFSFKMIFF